MRVVASLQHALHAPETEFVMGRVVPAYESPDRATSILAALEGRHEIAPPDPADREAIARVHDAAYLEHLERAWDDWTSEGHGGPLVADTFPIPGFGGEGEPGSAEARAGRYVFDASTPILEGTWRAAQAAAACSLTAASLLLEGEHAAYALCRPPGHHAGPGFGGGYCYLNNAAIGASALRQGHDRVAIIDVDYHHGNGTQAIFWDDPSVLFVSLHADPDREFPYYTGRANERGGRGAEGSTVNLPLPPETGDDAYLEAAGGAVERIGAWEPGALVVSLGLDAYEGDPLGRFDVTEAGFARLAGLVASLDVPTLVVQEGGYAVEDLGTLVAGFLGGLEGQSSKA